MVCCVCVMSIRRITISVPEETAQRIKAAAAGQGVSTWVTRLVEAHLDDAELERLWNDFYRQVAPTRADARRAGALYRRLTRPRPKSGAA